MPPETPPLIRAAAACLPDHYVDQETLIAVLRALWASKHHNVERLEQLHRAVRVSGRHLALPLEEYPALDTFARRNDAWIRAGSELGARALDAALAKAGLGREELGHLFFVTTTGVAVPSLDARIANRLSLPVNMRRTPIFGLGCAAGAAGVARAADWLRAYPASAAAVVSVELCSLTLQRDDLSVPNLIASGLFGDGAAAVVLTGGEREGPGPRVADSLSVFYPDTESVMGWDVVDTGFKVVLSAKVPSIARQAIAPSVDALLASHGLDRQRIAHWICHPGGPKVLEGLQEGLGLSSAQVERSWRSLDAAGNLSSASVLFVLAGLLEDGPARPGDHGVLLSMGPGFCSEVVLLSW